MSRRWLDKPTHEGWWWLSYKGRTPTILRVEESNDEPGVFAAKPLGGPPSPVRGDDPRERWLACESPPPVEGQAIEDAPVPLKEWQRRAYEAARAKGFYEGPPDLGRHVANLHSEVSEMWKEWVRGRGPTEVYTDDEGKLSGIPVELADLFIRTVGIAEDLGLDLEHWVRRKIENNASRGHRHGGRRA